MLFINNIKIAIRNAMRNRLFSMINIVGLALGLACCLVIVLYVSQELSYDKHHADADRIYRIGIDAKINDTQIKFAGSQAPAGKSLVSNFPEIESYLRISNFGKQIIKIKEKKFEIKKIYGADSTFFDFFDTKFIAGNKNALKKSKTIVLSESIAKRYFNTPEEAMGQTISLNNKDFNVTAVVKDSPYNTHIKYNALVSLIGNPRAESDVWGSDGMMTYFKTSKNTDYKALEKDIQILVQKHLVPMFKKYLNLELNGTNYYRYYIMPLTDIHLHSNTISELEENGNIMYVNMFIIIAIFILLIACINFSNLSTAKASNRAKEIGVKKSMGSSRGRLMAQFFTESIFISLIGFFIAIVIVETSIPYISSYIGVELNKSFYNDHVVMSIFIGIAILTGLISGCYSAIFLSSFNPVKILKGELTVGKNNAKFRGALVIFQFAISIFLIICTLIINKQFNYIQNKDIGYTKENFIKIENANLIKNHESFKQQINNISEVESVTFASHLPGEFCNGNTILKYNSEDKNAYNTRVLSCDDDFLKTMKTQLVLGRFYSKEFSSDSTAIIINECAVKEFGLTNPIESEFIFPGDEEKKTIYKVIGVIKDYHDVSLKTKVQPLIMFHSGHPWFTENVLGIRFKNKPSASTMMMIENTWNEFSNETPFNYTYFDDIVTELHIKEKNSLRIFTAFSAIAIFIALIGLLGLVSFTIDQKVKEIGVRKILGAPISSIVTRLNMDIIKWIGISFIIACPCAFFIMDNWLQDFIYRINIGVLVFVLSGISTLLITLSTVSWQAIRAAKMNPVDCLRSE